MKHISDISFHSVLEYVERRLSTLLFVSLCSLLITGCSSMPDMSNRAFTRDGAMRKGEFSISPVKTVRFSRGNLQYHPTLREWRFAPTQYDYCGKQNCYVGDTYNDWIDLFAWGTGNAPTRIGDRSNTTFEYVRSDFEHYIDWGNNAISNGGKQEGRWRTLSIEEWNYLFAMRKNASSLYGSAVVCGVNGLVVLPDDWTAPEGVTFMSGMHDWPHNTFTTEQWHSMEKEGAVFLPAAGYRDILDVFGIGEYGAYWSSSCGNAGDAGHCYFRATQLNSLDFYIRRLGSSVRLVR